jgi:Papain family cysteine protease
MGTGAESARRVYLSSSAYVLALALPFALLGGVGAQDKPMPTTAESALDSWPKLRSRGGELYHLDAVFRQALVKEDPKTIPATMRNLPDAKVSAFDWTRRVAGPRHIIKQLQPHCWAVSSVSALEWCWAIRNGETLPHLSTQPVLDETQLAANSEGARAADVLDALYRRGTALVKTYPYTGKVAGLRRDVELRYRVIAWGEVLPRPGVSKEAAIKQALLDHGPVTATVIATPKLQQHRGARNFREAYKALPNSKPPIHRVVIVGWDDRMGKGCFKVQNSWGAEWGDGGFAWLEYGTNELGEETHWLRPQSTLYQLPENVHKQLVGPVAPFPKWPKAATIALPPEPKLEPVSVQEALKMPGQRVLVRFTPKMHGVVNKVGHVMLLSEVDPKADNCLYVWILKPALESFPAQEPRALVKHYWDKELLIHGTVSYHKVDQIGRPIALIEVDEPGQIEIVKK